MKRYLTWILALVVAILATVSCLFFTEAGRRLRRKYVNPDAPEKKPRKFCHLRFVSPNDDDYPEFFDDPFYEDPDEDDTLFDADIAEEFS